MSVLVANVKHLDFVNIQKTTASLVILLFLFMEEENLLLSGCVHRIWLGIDDLYTVFHLMSVRTVLFI